MKTSLELFEHRYKKGQKFSWLEMLDFAEAYAAQQSTLSESKVMEVFKSFEKREFVQDGDGGDYSTPSLQKWDYSKAAKAICSLSVVDIAQVGEEEIKQHLVYFADYINEAISQMGPMTFPSIQNAVNVWFTESIGKEWLQSLQPAAMSEEEIRKAALEYDRRDKSNDPEGADNEDYIGFQAGVKWLQFLQPKDRGCSKCKAGTKDQIGNMYVCEYCGIAVP